MASPFAQYARAENKAREQEARDRADFVAGFLYGSLAPLMPRPTIGRFTRREA